MTLRHIIALIIAAAVIITISCTRNDGNIGSLFGAWRLESVTIDGVSTNIPAPQTWAFQNDIICISVADDMHTATPHYGTWQHDPGKTLTLRFDHSDATSDASATGRYDFPSGIGIPPHGIFTMLILSEKPRRLELQYLNPADPASGTVTLALSKL